MGRSTIQGEVYDIHVQFSSLFKGHYVFKIVYTSDTGAFTQISLQGSYQQ